jgi:putative DNA primase/helicase
VPLPSDPEHDCKRPIKLFWTFLKQITTVQGGDTATGDEDMAAFLLQWLGAGLFGFTPEQKFLILTGIGRNGKGTLKNAVLEALGDYAKQSDANLYMRSRHGAATSREARADLMDLKGTRLAFFSEPEGGRFNDELLKAHTGGDTISARPLFSNNVAHWKATHSVTFLVNDLPAVDDVGPSMSNRVLVADFQQRYEGPNMDTKLDEKLAGEAEGILAALVWAAGVWYSRREADLQGLVIPGRVELQSKHFIERNNPVAQAIAEAFWTGPDATCGGQVAYDTYKEWHTRSGQDGDPVSSVKFALELERAGFTRLRRINNIRGWKGLRPLGAMELADRGGDDSEVEEAEPPR